MTRTKPYADKLKHPKWQKKRLEVLKRDKFKCKLCGDEETTLHVHHKEYSPSHEPWEYDTENFMTLCEDCHFELTLIQDNKRDIDYTSLRLYKSNNWNGGNRIMFVSMSGTISMRIYNIAGDYIVGFNLADIDLKMIKSLISKI